MVATPTAIFAYVGAQPGGRPAPNLADVPVITDPMFGFVFTLAFAKDTGGGNFQPVWDPAITPDVIAQLKQGNESIEFRASLGGDANYGPWIPPSDQVAWIDTATSSLSQLMQTYHLDGLDIDYEGGPAGLDASFVQCISQVLINLSSPTRSAFTSIAPFGGTVAAYQSLYEQCSTWISSVNYQAYADELPDVQAHLDLYARLGQQFESKRLGLGIASSTSAPRGLQPPDIYTVWDSLHADGIGTAAIWCLEDSLLQNPPFAIETAIQARS
jgi:hypothetical protein